MNERIRELAEQANTIGDWGEDITEGRYFVYPNIKNLEKFAELIIDECLRMCDCAEASLLEHSYPRESDGAASVKIFIKEHFGVKE